MKIWFETFEKATTSILVPYYYYYNQLCLNSAEVLKLNHLLLRTLASCVHNTLKITWTSAPKSHVHILCIAQYHGNSANQDQLQVIDV